MQIENHTDYKEIPISELGLSSRVFNALMRAGYKTVYLLIENYNNLSSVRFLGNRGIDEINDKLAEFRENGKNKEDYKIEVLESDNATKEICQNGNLQLPDDILNRSSSDLNLSVRILHALEIAKIDTIREILALSEQEILNLRNIGTLSQQQLIDEIRLLCEQKDEYFERTVSAYSREEEESEVAFPQKGFDFTTIDILSEEFFFKPAWMTEWFNLSRQAIYNALEKRPPLRRDSWINKQLDEKEKIILLQLIKDKSFYYNDDFVVCHILNNRENDLACVFVYEEQIKCFFLKDLPDDLQQLVREVGFQKYTEKELAGGNEGKVIYYIRKPFFLPANPNVFRANAKSRGMTTDEYSIFWSGYPLGDSRSVTDEQVIEHFQANLVDGKVYISSDPKHQRIRSLASRNGYTIKEFIELYGYESAFDGTELTTNGARVRHIDALKKYIVHDNVVYFPTDSHIYKIINTYCFNRKISISKYLKSLGYERTTMRPEMEKDILETDMRVRTSDKNEIESIYAKYPLLGSKLFTPEKLDDIHQRAREDIDYAISYRWTELNLYQEMRITLSLINYAKDWVIENNSSFWDYILLQFGYRGTNEPVRRILLKSLEDSLIRRNRLFIEDANGKAYKSTAVIHAFSTRKSWMSLFDFLFDFYKNNLNWKYIPEDPLFKVMVDSLQKKIDATNTEDAELEISSRVYSFQEGIRKLILTRPIYTRELFEKLIGRIDALVNSATLSVNTYEEHLCEEWFEEKITSIANSRRSERLSQSIPREVVIDYARIRPRFLLKNENNIFLILPDIRLKKENNKEVWLSVYYDQSLVLHQRMKTYGDELGKSLSSVSLQLPSFNSDIIGLNIRVLIGGDDELIYNSEETLYRMVFIFDEETEIRTNQIKRDKYTVVLPQNISFDIQNAEVSTIDDFRILGLKAYYIELEEGFVLTINGKILSFDSNGGSDIRVLMPGESIGLPVLIRETDDCYFAYKGSSCSILLSDPEFAKQYVILKNGKKIEFSNLISVENSGGLVFSCPIGLEENMVRIQLINLDNERLVFDRSFIPISAAECKFNREFYYSTKDYANAELSLRIDDFEESISFTEEDEEIIVPYRDGLLHVNIPRVFLKETTGLWMNSESTTWYIGNIPQNSFFEVFASQGIEIRFLVGGKDILYDGQGLVTIGNILQSIAGTDNLLVADIVMEVKGKWHKEEYLLSKVYFYERFLKSPKFWTNDGKLFWDQGGGFIGKHDRVFTILLTGEQNEAFEVKMDENTECVDFPVEAAIGNYSYAVSIVSGSLFKKEQQVIAKGDCIFGDQNLLRFRKRKITIYAVTDKDNEDAGHIPITPCYIDHIDFLGVQETSEGKCPVYKGILYMTGYHGERYEFSYEEHINSRGVKKIMVNPVRIVYVGESSLCITDLEGDGLYYYHYYNRHKAQTICALTDHKYTQSNKRNYSNADLYLYRTERI